jgi:hypothetical protein
MASSCQVQVFLDYDYECTLKDLRELRDRVCTDPISTEAVGGAVMVRQIANRITELYDEILQLKVYQYAMDSMAAQMVHPKMTGLEMANAQLGITK